jgi:hypothetical protein
MNHERGERHQPDQSFGSRATRLEESVDSSKVDYILKAGLASDKSKLNYYRRVVQNPKRFPQEPILRPYGGELLDTLLTLVFTDAQMWNRLKTLLTRRRQNVSGLREEVSDSGLRSLIEKSLEHELPLETILEVYSRGAEIGGEREGFGRVNSFLAGGKAARLDEDLIVEAGPRMEPVRNKSNTLATVKRVLKEKTK